MKSRVGRVVPHKYSPVREPRAAGPGPGSFLFGAIFCLTCLTSLTSRNRPLPGTLRNPVQITAVSIASEAGVPIEEIAALAGHSTTRTTELVYRKELRPVLRTGATVMGELLAAGQ